ncbi:MAG: type II toxin-antitoxin system mRNA interferase toxin, RelE/StbE family [Gammaproteobacteria bacterium]|nr:type II toxin-antitoxin system mRNA interferase toxin, RelE/StbE family [Kiritimatiellia bacterium]NKB61977.1 type II toxin-antitoxin system mRNA interferase toxin, RelE/StbE family [Gammaproteobacteria bacterium]
MHYVKKTVVWSPTAKAKLTEQYNYLLERNPKAAVEVVQFIQEKSNLLGALPKLGRKHKGELIRKLTIRRYPYSLIYRITDTEIRILHFKHHRQLNPKI